MSKINKLNVKKNKVYDGKLIIAIDGPSGVGKSTIAKMIADKYNLLMINSGKIYRTIAYYVMKVNEFEKILNDDVISYEITNNEINYLLNNEFVTNNILYSQDNTIYTEKISSNLKIRMFVEKFINSIIKNENRVIMEGRDITSNVLKEQAGIKIFLCADLNIRIFRRFMQLRKYNDKISIEEVRKSIIDRDYKDLNRENGKLTITNDSIILNTSDLAVKQVIYCVDRIINYSNMDIQNKINTSYILSKLDNIEKIFIDR